MIPYGMLLDELYGVLSAHNDRELQIRIKARAQYEYFRICQEMSWQFLRCPPVTLDMSSDDYSVGMLLPADVLGIDLVWDGTNNIEFMRTTRQMAQSNLWGYRYYTHTPSRTDLYTGDDLVLQHGASQFTSADLTSDGTDPNGEYVTFGDSPGYYKITSSTTPFTFEPAYYGDDRGQDAFRIRPWEASQRLVIIDPDETALTDRSVDVYYWRAPVPLYRDEDMIMLPSAEVLKLRVLRGIHEAKERSPVSEAMLQRAAKECKALNPPFGGVNSPRDKHGNRFEMSGSIFKQRGT